MVEKVQERVFLIRDLEALRVVSDPLRVRIVAAAAREPASVKEIAAALQMAPGKLYYHVELLERHGLLLVDSTRVVSGITEKRYRAVSSDIRVDRRVLGSHAPAETLDGLLSAVLDATRTEAEASARNGVLAIEDDRDALRAGLFSRTNLRLSPARAAELRGRLDELLAEYRTHAGGDGEPYDLTVAFFPVAEGA